MSEMDLTEEDLEIIYGRSAIAAFAAVVARAVYSLGASHGGEALQDSFLKALNENLGKTEVHEKHEDVKQYCRVFLAFYQDPNFPGDHPLMR